MVAPQALHLMNNGMVEELAEQFARRIDRDAGADLAKQIDWVYLVALSRLPSAAERKIGKDALDRLTDAWVKSMASAAMPDRDLSRLKALTTYCHAVMNSASFLYVD